MKCLVTGGSGYLGSSLIEFLSKNSDWSLIQSDDSKKIERIYKFKNFRDALEFTNLVGEVAESEGHHPQIITEWGSVLVRWWSHKLEIFI